MSSWHHILDAARRSLAIGCQPAVHHSIRRRAPNGRQVANSDCSNAKRGTGLLLGACLGRMAAARLRGLPAQGFTDARQVVPAVPQCVVLNDELRGDRRAEAQREGRRLIQLVIRERAYCGGGLTTVPAQEFKRGGLRYPGMSWACLPFNSATTSHVTSVNALPLAIARATSISIGYMLATWCTMTPTGRRSVPDTGVRHSASESPSAKAARPAAPSSMRSANNSARRPVELLVLVCGGGLWWHVLSPVCLDFVDQRFAVSTVSTASICGRCWLDTYPIVWLSCSRTGSMCFTCPSVRRD